MENIENVTVEKSFMNNKEINDYLLEISKWGKFLAIAGFAGMGILVIISIFLMIGSSFLNSFSGHGLPLGAMGAIYFFIALIYFFPVNYLFKFSVLIKKGVFSNDENTITSGFKNLKSLFKFIGIFMIIILSIYVLIIIAALAKFAF